MRREKALNFVAVVFFVVVFFVAFRLFRPSPFVLRATCRTRGHITQVAFSPKGDILAATVVGPGIRADVWQVPSGQLAQSFALVTFAPGGIGFNPLAFSSDGRLLAVGYEERGVNKICVFNVADGRRLKTIVMGKSSALPSVAFVPDGKLAVTHNGRLWFVRVESGEKIQTEIQAAQVTFSPNGLFIAAYPDLQDFVAIFDAKGQPVRRLEVKAAKASSRTNGLVVKATFSQDGQKFVCLWNDWKQVGRDFQMRRCVSVWRTKDWKLERLMPLTPFQTFTDGYGDISLDGSLVAVPKISLAGWDGLWWRLRRFFNILSARLSKSPIALPDPPLKVSVYRLEDGQLIAEWEGAYGAAFSPDGRYLAVLHGKEFQSVIALWEFRGVWK